MISFDLLFKKFLAVVSTEKWVRARMEAGDDGVAGVQVCGAAA